VLNSDTVSWGERMISISKPKLKVLLIVTIFLLPNSVSLIQAHGFTYTRTLPSNTIYYDDSVSLNGWTTETFGTTTGSLAQLNSTLAFDSSNSIGLYEPNANAHIGVYKNIALPQGVTKVGIAAWVTFNYAMYVTNDGQAPELSLWWWSLNSLPNTIQFHHAMVEYRPNKGQFEAFTPDDGSPTQMYRFRGADGTRDGYFAYNDQLRTTTSQNMWHWEKFVVDLSSNQYISYCESVGCFANVTGRSIGNTAGAGTAPTGAIEGQASTIVGIDVRVTNDATQLNANALFDDILLTDETVPSTQAFFAALELWKAVATMGSMMSVVTMYSTVRAYREPDPIKRRTKLMVGVVFAIGAVTLAIFAIILAVV